MNPPRSVPTDPAPTPVEAPAPPLPQRSSRATRSPPPPSQIQTTAKKVSNTRYQSRTNLLYVSDSVGRNVDLPMIEKDLNCTIKTAKAYSSTKDKKALWPDKNFTEVAKDELEKSAVDYVVMSAPTVDIPNVDTTQILQSDSLELYQQMVYESSANMIASAERAIEDNANIKKVIILEHAPRYDSKEVDPLSLKTDLAKYANNALAELWKKSKLKQKIKIGIHHFRAPGSGSLHDSIFRNTRAQKYDGVHFYGYLGRQIYSKSVHDIIQDAFGSVEKQKNPQTSPDYHQSCPQTLYQLKQQNYNFSKHVPSVQVSNRFDIFNSNLGNL